MGFQEAERQALITMIELEDPAETPNNTHYTFYPKTIEEAGRYFLNHRQDIYQALPALSIQGLITPSPDSVIGYRLTPAGQHAACQERSDYPPIHYWYRTYFNMAEASPAYARFCGALYGRDLRQSNFSDMEQIDFMINLAHPQHNQYLHHPPTALDLGCGSGLFAEYLADSTGAVVTGLDYIPEAIQQARHCFSKRTGELNFILSNFDHLDLPSASFDLITSIDTIYMPKDLPGTLSKLWDLLSPGGQMFIFYLQILFDPTQPRSLLLPENNDLAAALRAVGLPYNVYDFTEPTFHLMRRKHDLAREMRADFEAEGTLFLYDHLIAESNGGTTPYDRTACNLSRFLYQIQKGH